MAPDALAARRKKETEAVAAKLGIEYVVMDSHDGWLTPTVEVRAELIRVLRRFAPDLVITHPVADYHPDHRYTTQIVSDTSYMLETPLICPDVPAMDKRTAYAYCFDKSAPIDALSVAVSVDEVWNEKMEALALHESQFFEWLPFIERETEPVPEDHDGRLRYLSKKQSAAAGKIADAFRERLRALYGEERGSRVARAEAFYSAPFGPPISQDNYREFFPFW